MRFRKWLEQKLDDRSWSYADLAERAKIGKSTVSMIMSEQRNPGPDFCLAIAEALNVPAVIVFQKAGLLPDEIVGTPHAKEAAYLFRQLSDRQQRDLLTQMRALVDENRRRLDAAQIKAEDTASV